jgi:glycosyltransferase involved in cell wall biosynthesis
MIGLNDTSYFNAEYFLMSKTTFPKISVIVPTYNCSDYLSTAVESVLAQNYLNTEIIVIDDGSTDDTRDRLQPYRDRLRYLYQPNQGVSVARNRGIQEARGEFIAFLDADDYFLPNKLTAQVALFVAQPQLGIVHSGWRRVDRLGNPLMEVTPWEKVPELNLESWLRWKPVLPSAMMFRRDWLIRAGGFDRRFPPAEDTDLVLRLALMGCEADWLRQVTVCYRQHPGSAMYKGLPQANSLAAVMDNFFSLPQVPMSIRLIEKRVRYNTLVWIGWYLYFTGHPQEMVQFLQQSWNYSPYLPVETVVHWVESFAEFSRDVGEGFDRDRLTQLPEWEGLIRWATGGRRFEQRHNAANR